MKFEKIRILAFIESIVDPFGKYIFIKKIKENSNVLDVGCGNVTYKYVNTLNKTLNYTGVDVVSDYYDDKTYYELDFIHFVSPDKFNAYIKSLPYQYDTILSIHNIEHCHNAKEIWEIMLDKLKINGKLYLRTPSKESINFPAREGTLNFYDDRTHQAPVPIIEYLKELNPNEYNVVFFKDPYFGTFITRFLGLILEPISKIKNKVISKITWHFWGFETIIIIERTK